MPMSGCGRSRTGTWRCRTSRSSAALYIGICIALGLLLAILLDQRIRGEGVLRPIYLYPMALSFIVTGTAWKWFLNPGLGLEKTMQPGAWESFKFDWLINPDMAIYTVVIAGVWQASGFVMAMFLAGLRGIDGEILKAAQIDGASTVATLPAHRHSAAAAGLPVGRHRARAHGDQVLRPRHRADRRRARQRHRAALDLHVFLHLHAQPDGGRRGQRGDHADDDLRPSSCPISIPSCGSGAHERRCTSAVGRLGTTSRRGSSSTACCSCSRCSTCCRSS